MLESEMDEGMNWSKINCYILCYWKKMKAKVVKPLRLSPPVEQGAVAGPFELSFWNHH